MKNKKVIIPLALIISLLCGGQISAQNVDKNTASKHTPLPIEEIKTFVDVYMQIKNRYIDEISDEELINKAIKGMLEGLDPHSDYLGKTTFEKLTSDTKGQFGGVGVRILTSPEGVLVDSPIDNSPATDVDIRRGDLIIEIAGEDTRGLEIQKVKGLMRGEPGSKLQLVIKREGENNLLEKTIIRDVIQLETISSTWLNDKIAYIRLSQFQSASAASLRDKIFAFQKDTSREFKGLVFDLRNNPGGLLTTAVSVSDVFLESGKIVITKSRSVERSDEYIASPKDFTNGVPMVVLIDKGSASASEIVSGALQDNGRAKIIGTQSYGKGSVQSLINLSDSRALKLTTGKYYTPSGKSIHELGITPDIYVELEQIVNAESADVTSQVKVDSQISAAIKFLNSNL